MSFEMTVTHETIRIDIPDEDFIRIMRSEGLGMRELYIPTLVDLTDKIDGLAEIEYDGHFGAALHVRIVVEDHKREDILKSITDVLQERLDELRLIENVMPVMFEIHRHRIPDLMILDSEGHLKLSRPIYACEDFVLSYSDDTHGYYAFFNHDGKVRRVSVSMDSCASAHDDMYQRSVGVGGPVTMSRDMPDVEELVKAELAALTDARPPLCGETFTVEDEVGSSSFEIAEVLEVPGLYERDLMHLVKGTDGQVHLIAATPSGWDSLPKWLVSEDMESAVQEHENQTALAM